MKTYQILVSVVILSLVILQPSNAQTGRVGVGTNSPDPSAMLDVTSTVKGVLLPRMTKTQRDAIQTPATGLLIYQTDSIPGYYFYGPGWTLLNSSTSAANRTLSNLISPTAVNADLYPGSNSLLNLGGSTALWKNLYLSDDVYLQGVRFLSSRGNQNAFAGHNAGNAVTTGSLNAALGANALFYDSSGEHNTASGAFSLYYNGTGSNNSANGYSSLYTNTSGANNTANGAFAMYYNTTGFGNTANGSSALYFNTLGAQNTATGSFAMTYNTTGNNNAADGFYSLYWNSSGGYNNAFGTSALYNNTEGNYNTGIGAFSIYSNQANSGNTAVGYNAGYFSTANSTFLGASAYSASSLTNVTVLGYGAYGTASNSVKVGNTSVTSIGGYAGWTTFPSDRRYKRNIQEDVPGLAFINKLRPVTYNVDAEGIERAMKPASPGAATVVGKGTAKHPLWVVSAEELKAIREKSTVRYTGFIAQEVEDAAKATKYDFSGVDAPKNDKDFYGLRYAEFVVPLVKAVQELSKTNEEKDAKIVAMEKRLQELESAIQLLLQKAK